jgi:predicted transcriptional regulator
MSRPITLGQLQLSIMRVLWRLGEASVAQVHEELRADRGRALTTIATMLTKLEKKGVVSHRSEGRLFVYRAEVSESAVQRSMVEQLTESLFAGDAAALASHLLSSDEIERGELAELKRLIARRELESRARAPGRREPGEPRPDVPDASAARAQRGPTRGGTP